MHVYVRRDPQSFHLENGINRAQHITAGLRRLIRPVRWTMHKYTIICLWFKCADTEPVRLFCCAVNNVCEEFEPYNSNIVVCNLGWQAVFYRTGGLLF